ncbi:TPA: NrdH-redoxin [Candidatus Woesearchaeota archaeon]|nr:NrdH-redoxin [Candidatus Woesearchaeota archaeon]HII69116.1 NrdH-redoxin [Candidatus Woesearchaeota archaeon]
MAKQVTVYSTQSCPWCVKAKDFLKECHIKFEEKDVGVDEEARDVMLEKTGQMGVPVIDIEGSEPIIGFDVEAIKEALADELKGR